MISLKFQSKNKTKSLLVPPFLNITLQYKPNVSRELDKPFDRRLDRAIQSPHIPQLYPLSFVIK